MKLWFETHSTSVDNERGVASGHRDPPLSDAGRRQAAELGERCAARNIRTVYTSDLKRAISTAEIAFAASDTPVLVDARLRECDYGSWSGCPSQKLREAQMQFLDEAFPGGESYRDVVRRMDEFLRDVRRDTGPVLVIGHRVPWYALEHLIRQRDLAEVVGAPWKWEPGWEYDL